MAFIFAVLFLGFGLYVLYRFLNRNFDHWAQCGIPYLKPELFFGHLKDVVLQRTIIGELLGDLYRRTSAPYIGIFIWNTPYLLVRSPELIKQILITSFQQFDDRIIQTSGVEPIEPHLLFVAKRPDWHIVRTKFAPCFSQSKLRIMAGLIEKITRDMFTYVDSKGETILELSDVCSRFSLEALTRCCFAIDAHAFTDDQSQFRAIGHELFGFSYKIAVQQMCSFFAHPLMRLFRMRLFPAKAYKFLRHVFWEIIERRERSNDEVQSSDTIGMIIQLRKDEEFCRNFKFYGDKAIAQAAQFFFAGIETISTTMSFALYELALNPVIQSRLRAEIRDVLGKHDNTYSLEAVSNMKYLHKCLCETLRKYPAFPFLDRVANSNFVIPGTDQILQKGTKILIPTFGLHYDSDYFPNPKKFDPERFESNENFHNAMYYMPFGQGPRHCIGERLGILSAKIGIAFLLANFCVDKVDSTPDSIQFKTKSLLLESTVGLPMRFRKL